MEQNKATIPGNEIDQACEEWIIDLRVALESVGNIPPRHTPQPLAVVPTRPSQHRRCLVQVDKAEPQEPAGSLLIKDQPDELLALIDQINAEQEAKHTTQSHQERLRYAHPEDSTKQAGRLRRMGATALGVVTRKTQQAKQWLYVVDYYGQGEKRLNRKKAAVAAVGGIAVAAVGVYVASKFSISFDDIFGRQEAVVRPKSQAPAAGIDLFPGRSASRAVVDAPRVPRPLGTMFQQIGERIGDVVPRGGTAPQTSMVEHIAATDTPWDVLSRQGVSGDQIMQRLDTAARTLHTEQGTPFAWHGTGGSRWLEINGQSDTTSIMTYLRPYLG